MFKFKAVQPATFEHEIYSVQLFSRENLKTPQMKSQGCFDTRFFACLTFSSKWVTFFSKDSSNFRQYFGGVFLKSVLFILCFLQTLETKRCWLWRAFAHVSPTLRSESFGIYIWRKNGRWDPLWKRRKSNQNICLLSRALEFWYFAIGAVFQGVIMRYFTCGFPPAKEVGFQKSS